jgi:hypothetical protein
VKWFRPVIITALAVGFTAGFFTGLIDPTAYGVFATGLITYWFKARDKDKDK